MASGPPGVREPRSTSLGVREPHCTSLGVGEPRCTIPGAVGCFYPDVQGARVGDLASAMA